MQRFILCLALAAAVPAGAYELKDSLKNATIGNRVGGTLTANGWQVTSKEDRVWYALPTLISGSMEVTVAGIVSANLTAADNEIFALYEGGYGIAEPIRYSPEFRENQYKALLRIYGVPEGARAGQQKLMWGMCNSGTPGYGPCTCSSGKSFFEEPFGGNGAWDGTPQRLRLEWGNGVTRFLRNGVEAVRVDWANSGVRFGPSGMHFMFGSPRNSAIADSHLPVGAVFSDLVISGVEGTVATCTGGATPLPPPDAGVVVPDAGIVVPDAGVAGPDAGSVVPDSGVAVGSDAGSSSDAGTGAADAGPPQMCVPMASSGGCGTPGVLAPLWGLVLLAIRIRRTRR